MHKPIEEKARLSVDTELPQTGHGVQRPTVRLKTHAVGLLVGMQVEGCGRRGILVYMFIAFRDYMDKSNNSFIQWMQYASA